MAEETQPKWEGKATAELKGPTPDQVFPAVDTCCRIKGVQGQPGLIRYCTSTAKKCFSYEVLDNNMGFKNYVATVRVMPMNDEDGKMRGCMIEWSFVSNPVEGWGLQDLSSLIDISVQSMAKKIENAIQEASV
ncbi:hypothetical protein EUGRSUZ_C02968 [Eucalyptus grandis]|uniref:Uncharacterized protein n=2 Tax=Eucalyptus grandis TaxID=71139 RepID=A0ACC3LJ58_EUCGR|nr:hypothetical protein EUGRSUZ_C02968 [Eucalyptus grandis]